jgi:GH43 family beta-xylosidase
VIVLKRKVFIFFSFAALAALVTVIVTFQNDEEQLGKGDEPMGDFFNVISQSGADPWMYKHTDDQYYYTKTTGGDVTLKRASTLTGIEAGENKVIWWPSGETAGFRDIWAPEIHYIEQKWYVYFAALSPENKSHRMYVLENASQDPFSGSWEFKGQITDPSDKNAIDGTVLENNGTKYLVWSGWEGDVNVSQNIYIATMSNPWTINSERVEISRPEHVWEMNHQPYINEGPQFIVQNETINLVYSASGSWTEDYCLELITANRSDDLMNPESWLKRDQSIFKSANGLIWPRPP